MSIVIGKRLTIAFGLVLLLLLVNGIVSYQSTRTLITHNQSVIHTQEVLYELEQTALALRDAESMQRGFLISRDNQFLEPYNSALAVVEGHLSNLSKLTADNPTQLAQIPGLREAINKRIRTLAENLSISEKNGIEAVVSSQRFFKGKQEMDDVRQVLKDMEDEENRLLKVRLQQSENSGTNTILTFIISNFLALAMLLSIFYLLNRDVKERRKAEEELQAAHDVLEAKVLERTAELRSLNEELNDEIFDRKSAEEKLKLFTVELERSNRELQDFAFVASHDLQEPLRKIQAFGDRLGTKFGGTLGNDGRDYLERMQNAAHRMHVLINDLLTFSRVTTKAQPFALVDLKEIAGDVLKDLEVRVQQSGGVVEVGQLMSIEADPLQMRQLIQNLTGNALKFQRPGVAPLVRIESRLVERPDGYADSGQNGHKSGDTEETKSFCRLTVADNGIGFDEKYLDRIFTPFQRLHGRNEYEGTGMGLAVCRKIVERHGGEITAKSTPGTGTTFIVDLPVTQNQESN